MAAVVPGKLGGPDFRSLFTEPFRAAPAAAPYLIIGAVSLWQPRWRPRWRRPRWERHGYSRGAGQQTPEKGCTEQLKRPTSRDLATS